MKEQIKVPLVYKWNLLTNRAYQRGYTEGLNSEGQYRPPIRDLKLECEVLAHNEGFRDGKRERERRMNAVQ